MSAVPALALSVALGCILPLGCAAGVVPDPTSDPSPGGVLRYVALGDSYTIGTGVGEVDRWPNQLVDALSDEVALQLVANLGVNGASSDDLIAGQLPEVERLEPDFVSVLIGVNDVVRRVPAGRYRDNLDLVLGRLLALLPPARIVVVSTPDYTLTPMGNAFGEPAQQRAAIAEFNAVMARAADVRGIAFVDIGPVADRVPADRALVAADGLHPSRAQYAAWVELIAPVVSERMER